MKLLGKVSQNTKLRERRAAGDAPQGLSIRSSVARAEQRRTPPPERPALLTITELSSSSDSSTPKSISDISEEVT